MATKQFLTLEGLSTYNDLIKQYIGTEDAKSIKSITVSGNTVSFFKTEDASGTAAYTVNMPDVSGFMDKIASATGGKIVTSLASGQVSESATAISDLATNEYVGEIPSGATAATVTAYAKEVADSKDTAIAAAQAAADAAQDDVDALETLVGAIPAGASATTVVGYSAEVADAAEDAAKDYADGLIAALDTASDVTIASKSGNVVTLKAGIKEQDGVIAQGTGSDIALAEVASTGAAEDVAYDNTDSGLTATDVQEAIDELAEASSGGVASKTVYLQDESAGQSDYAKVYKLYQGANAPDAQTDPATLIGTINIPKDLFIKSASVQTVTTPDVPYKGAEVGDKYIDIEIQNQANHLYVPANSLVDIYTGGTTAEATVAIDANNEITVSINEINGSKLAATSVAKGKLATAVQDSLDLADSAVQSVAEGSTNGTIAVDGTDVAVHGLGSAAYENTTAFDASGAAATAKSEVIGTSGDVASASTIYGAKAYADASTEAIPTASIQALFNN